MYEIITLELNYSSHAWRLVSPYHIVASPHLAWFWLYCCVPHKIFSISSSSLRPVCFDRRNAARPPGSRLNILSDTNSGFYSIRNPADTHCCPSRTNPAFLLVGWCHTGLAKTPICQQLIKTPKTFCGRPGPQADRTVTLKNIYQICINFHQNRARLYI